MMDEMAIKQHTDFRGRKGFGGFVDFGSGTDAIGLPEAKDALVFMIVALNSHWKVPCGYFFTAGTSSEMKANLIKLCLIRAHEAGVQVF